MKRYLVFALVLLFLTACNEKSKTEREIEKIPMSIHTERFDQQFFECKRENLISLKNKFPYFFPASEPDSVWVEKIENPQWKELYKEVQKKYPDFSNQKTEIEVLFKHIKFYFPKVQTPKLLTIISEMDYDNKVVYADSLVIVSLEMYLGKNHKFYEFPKYLQQNMEPSQIIPDIAASFIKKALVNQTQNDLISQMVTAGKALYLKDILLPTYADFNKIGYSEPQLLWCQENENYIWRYFIEKQLLYSDDKKLAARFIDDAPFSKFYLEIDNESPGKVGAYIGWQIVRSFMENNSVTVPELLRMDATELFKKSKYKPKK